MHHYKTMGEVLLYIKKSFNNPRALVNYEENGWRDISSKEMFERIGQLAFGLKELGIKKGDFIGIFNPSDAYFILADLAIMSIGAISVPIFINISDDNFDFEVDQTAMKTIFVGGADQWKRIEGVKGQFQNIISLDPGKGIAEAISLEEIVSRGKKVLQESPAALEEALRSIQPDDLATIVYTSGTSGVPKGVVHTHKSAACQCTQDLYIWDKDKDVFLSFLPLPHIFARIFNWIMLTFGISCYYYKDLKNLPFAFSSVKPTIAIVVPRLLEKIHAAIFLKAKSATGLKKRLALYAIALASTKKLSFTQKLLRPLVDLLVFKKFRAIVGGNPRVLVTGGAPISPSLFEFFRNIGFPLYEGYGLTEGCPVSVLGPDKVKIGSVGRPLDGVIVRLGENEELLVRGDLILREYYKNSEATAKAIDSEMWFHTGDKASIDDEGFIYIKGRIKELMKSSTGEYIAHVSIEHSLKKIPFIENAIVIGDGKKFVSCLLVPDFERLNMVKVEMKASHMSDQEFLNSEILQKEIYRHISEINRHLNKWEHVQVFRFLPKPLTVEEDELTPSMKVKRNVIETKYKEIIDSIYQENVH